MADTLAEPTGFLAINKPKKWTSFDVVAKLRTITGVDRIGHAGTLDPFATGLLVVAFGRATMLVDYIQQQKKTYRGRIRLGQTSDTDDVDGHKTTVFDQAGHPPVPPDEHAIRLALAKQTGTIQQLPPNYSALKVRGQRMYDLARKGVAIDRKPRPVTVYDFKLLNYKYPHLEIEASVSAGTYIRAIARDVGAELKTGGFLETLERTQIGSLKVADAYTIDDVQAAISADQRSASANGFNQMLLPPMIAVEHLVQLIPSKPELERLATGQTIRTGMALVRDKRAEVAIVTRTGQLQMLVEVDRQAMTLKMKKLFDMSLAR